LLMCNTTTPLGSGGLARRKADREEG